MILFFRYDRQLRLWGDHGQVALEKARVCMIGATATATEILKSLGQAHNMFSRIFRLRIFYTKYYVTFVVIFSNAQNREIFFDLQGILFQLRNVDKKNS